MTTRRSVLRRAVLLAALAATGSACSGRTARSRQAESALLWAPGTRYRYSNLGSSLLAPAGMAQTGYRLPEWDAGKVAVEYDRYGDPHGRPYEHRWDSDGPYWNLRGNGGILSTAEDMFRWHTALNGENGWSFAEYFRFLDEDLMVFWANEPRRARRCLAPRGHGPGKGGRRVPSPAAWRGWVKMGG